MPTDLRLLFESDLIKYYVIATISFLVAISFHAEVYRHFGEMEKGLEEAARIKSVMNYDELQALAKYHKSNELHRQGIEDTILAYEFYEQAYSLREDVFREKKNVQRLENDAKEKAEGAQVDERESAMYDRSSFVTGRASVTSTVTGMDLAQIAQAENEKSLDLMNKTTEAENHGKERLKEAQAALELAKAAQNHTEIDKGICYWAPVVCRTIEESGGSVTASDAVIKANKDIKNALAEIHDAEAERAIAIELHQNSSLHANLSTELLDEAQVYKTQSQTYGEDAKKFHESASEKEAEAEKDEEEFQLEERDIAIKEGEIKNDIYKRNALHKKVKEDRIKEREALARMNHYTRLVKRRKREWEEKKEEAIHHVAKAGWEALVASFSGVCLLLVVMTRIVTTFRYRQPLRWVLREEPYFSQDLLYLFCHVLIFLLAMGYVGELLMNFHDHKMLARTGITIVFALSASIIQITLLHLIPAVYSLLREARMESETVQLLLEKVVLKKGVIIAMVSAIEMLLCWCWIGTITFGRAFVLNSSLLWLAVLCMSLWYGIYIQTHKHAVADDLLMSRCDESSNVGSDGIFSNENEQHSLLVTSHQELIQGSVPLSGNQVPAILSSLSSLRSSETSPSMVSIPIGSSESKDDCDYGSLTNFFRAHLSTSPENFSWYAELQKVRLLFELLIASMAIWIVRRDLSLIRKLSPLANDLVWGKVPLWIVNILIFSAVATVVISFANMKRGRGN
eukprot:CAMPEP_0172364280 /NCGR_PEP_ID=MMETSP1060-20121228/7446_1 /TAXON_ID=37318 /ORGANISM="Pseudo-nitzschia pungens, Strain cf. cingulata" /LENGTH=739 /DNA_ID=CAMNT_0013087243 /DNA_START=365 /DNA_END=2585 /DNA_ORIENTATION=-